MTKDELPIVSFTAPGEWRVWLSEHHANPAGVWIRIFKKATGKPTVTHSEALDEALCYGWIDGQAKKLDDESYLQKFTPRRSKSLWSKRNRERIERLVSEGRMQPPGMVEVEAAKADGRWDRAYDSPTTMTIPEDFTIELAKNEKALAFFGTLDKQNLYAIGWRLQTAKKPETRQRRITAIIELLEQGQKLH